MKILHTADIHLGTNNYGRLVPETGLNSRLADFERSFRFMIDRALEENIDLFLFCGDAYRNSDPTPTQQRIFADCLKPIADRDIPIAMIVGNHDHPVSHGKASAIDIFGYLTGRVKVYRKPDLDTIQTKSGPLQLITLPWPIRSVILSKDEHRQKTPQQLREFIEEKYTEAVRVAVQELDPSLPTVLAAHLTVRGAEVAGSERTAMIGDEPTFGVSQLAIPPIDYVALGHIHKFQDRNPGGTPPVVYSSSIERVSFKECDDRKGFVLVDIDSSGGSKKTTYEFVETPARRFLMIDVDARQTPEPTEAVLRAISRETIDDAIVWVKYHIDEAQVPLVDLARIRESLRSADAIANIERKVDPVERQRRTIVNRETSLEDAIRHYVAQHDHLKPLEDELVRTGLELDSELDAQQRLES